MRRYADRPDWEGSLLISISRARTSEKELLIDWDSHEVITKACLARTVYAVRAMCLLPVSQLKAWLCVVFLFLSSVEVTAITPPSASSSSTSSSTSSSKHRNNNRKGVKFVGVSASSLRGGSGLFDPFANEESATSKHLTTVVISQKIRDAGAAIKRSTKDIGFIIPDGIKNGLASGLAAAVVKIILQPFDTIKTVQQAQAAIKLGPLAAGIGIVQKRGVGGLWSGIGVTVIGSSPSVAVYFGLYSSCKKRLLPYFPPSLALVAVALSAMIGNTVASVFRVPYEVFKQRIQNGQHSGTWDAVSWSLKNEGVIGLFGGGKLSSQIIRDVPYAMVTLVSYEILQSLTTKYLETLERENKLKAKEAGGKGGYKAKVSMLASKKVKDAVCGALAGGLGSLATGPMDVIKTRMMTGSTYKSVLDATIRIAKEEGLSTFFIGTTPRLLHKIPANGLFFLCYEAFRSLLKVNTL